MGWHIRDCYSGSRRKLGSATVRFEELALAGAYIVEPELHTDQRGFFARMFCEEEFATKGLTSRFPQSSISFNACRGTVRGMHFSVAPHEETKLVRCTAGVIYDVIVDLRSKSATYLNTIAVELSAQNHRALYIPTGLAHGFQALEDHTEVFYMIDTPFVPGAARGLRWNDPSICITWPEPITVISERDLQFPDWSP
jgi:dTDP-4-dehydrorhamnose 3,5-epimerase